MLIQIVDGAPFGNPVIESNFRQLFPNKSFPSPISLQDLDGSGYGLFEFTAEPAVTGATKAVEGTAELGSDGIWRQVWQVVDLEGDELTEYNSEKERTVRLERNGLLSSSDWTQAVDSPLSDSKKTEWAVYRQSLRDLPSASGFPHTMTWPTEPGS